MSVYEVMSNNLATLSHFAPSIFHSALLPPFLSLSLAYIWQQLVVEATTEAGREVSFPLQLLALP